MSSTASLAPFGALSASYFAHIGFFNPYLPLWLKDAGYSLFLIGIMTSVQSATRLFAPYAWGALSDRTGERVRLMRYSATVALLSSIGLWFTGPEGWGFVWVLVVLLIMFTHTSSMMPMSEAAMAHLVSSGGSFDAKRYGRVRVWGSAGFLVTVLGAGIWFEHFGIKHFPYWTVVTLSCVAAAVWWMPDLRENATTSNNPGAGVLQLLKQRTVVWFFASIFFHVLSHMSVYLFFSLYLDANGYSKSAIGMLWAVSVVVEIAFLYTQGRWLPLLSLTGWLVLCAGLCVVRMGLTATGVGAVAVLIAAQILHGFTFATHHTVCTALLSKHFPNHLRGRGQALYTVIGYGFTGVIGGLGGGALTSALGLASVFWASMLTSVFAFFCAWRCMSAHHRQA